MNAFSTCIAFYNNNNMSVPNWSATNISTHLFVSVQKNGYDTSTHFLYLHLLCGKRKNIMQYYKVFKKRLLFLYALCTNSFICDLYHLTSYIHIMGKDFSSKEFIDICMGFNFHSMQHHLIEYCNCWKLVGDLMWKYTRSNISSIDLPNSLE